MIDDLPIENVQAYPRPPLLQPVTQRIVIRLEGRVVADTRRALRVIETHHPPTYYLPPEDVQAALIPIPGCTFCEWKGDACYMDVRVGNVTVPRAAWVYDRPVEAFAGLRGFPAFYPALMGEVWVGAHRVTPQPGTFYGGWVTPNLTGTIKGAPGTRHW